MHATEMLSACHYQELTRHVQNSFLPIVLNSFICLTYFKRNIPTKRKVNKERGSFHRSHAFDYLDPVSAQLSKLVNGQNESWCSDEKFILCLATAEVCIRESYKESFTIVYSRQTWKGDPDSSITLQVTLTHRCRCFQATFPLYLISYLTLKTISRQAI